MKPFVETLRVTNPVRQSRASSRKRVLRGGGRPSLRRAGEDRQCSPLIGPTPLNKRHELQPRIGHQDVACSEVILFSIAVEDLPSPGLAARPEPSRC